MIRWRASLAALALGVAALAWMSWQFGVAELATALSHVSATRLSVYLIVSLAVVTAHSLRWRLVTRALGDRLPLPRLLAARLAGEAVGGLVPSAKLAGEPVRVALVYADGVAGAAASAGVSIDRLLEMISSILCGIVYVSIFSLTRVSASRDAPVVLALMIVLLVAVAVPLIMLRRGMPPLAPLYGAGVRRWMRPLIPWMPALRDTEAHLMRFFREHSRTFAAGLATALLAEALTIAQYWALLSAFAITLDGPTLLLALVGTGFAHSLPTPAGLGALEASQVSVLALATGRPDVGFVVGLVMRLHETLWIAIGLIVLWQQKTSLAHLRARMLNKAVA